jgi:hypothetical protein
VFADAQACPRAACGGMPASKAHILLRHRPGDHPQVLRFYDLMSSIVLSLAGARGDWTRADTQEWSRNLSKNSGSTARDFSSREAYCRNLCPFGVMFASNLQFMKLTLRKMTAPP